MKLTVLSLAFLAFSIGACNDSATCDGDHCLCTGDDCTLECTPGAPECHVQGAPGADVDVTCSNNAECHVECSQAASCTVDCGGSADCDVTCPPSGCTVSSCVDCEVTCGLTGIATHTGTTATCP